MGDEAILMLILTEMNVGPQMNTDAHEYSYFFICVDLCASVVKKILVALSILHPAQSY